MRLATFACALLGASASLSAQVFLDDDAPGDPGPNDPTVSDPLEDGSPEHPFDALLEAIQAAPGFTAHVVVEPGRYSGPGNAAIATPKSFLVVGRRGADETIFDLQGAKFLSVSGSFVGLEGLTVLGGSGASTGAVESSLACELQVFHCVFAFNHATGAGAVGGALTVAGSLNCANTAFLSNRSEGNGGAVAVAGDSDNVADHDFFYCTWRNNRAQGGGAALWFEGTASVPAFSRSVAESILWNNVALGGAHAQIGEAVPGNAHVSGSIVEGGWSGLGSANLDLDPVFAFPRDHHLSLASPALDLSGGLLCTVDPFDADGQLRGCGLLATDIGADEVQPITFTLGPAASDASLAVHVAGAVPFQPVTLVLGRVLAEPPIATVLGPLEVGDVHPVRLRMPPTDAHGASSTALSLAGLPSGSDLVLQALVGAELARATTVQVQ